MNNPADGGTAAHYRRLGAVCHRNGKIEHAIAAYRQAIAVDPEDMAALRGLATVLAKHGDIDGAARAWLAIAERHGTTPELQFHLAALGRGEPPAAVPASLVVRLFDSYAARFDRHLIDRLHYRVPRLLWDAVASKLSAARCDILDLGCGTGLCGALFRPVARSLDGVDLSPRMIDEARSRGIYDRLLNEDLVTALAAHPARYDLLLASDVLVYVGELAPVFEAARIALRPGGLMAFSVEAHEGDGIILRPTRRYAHGRAYLDRLAGACGFRTLHTATETLRLEEGEPVSGHIVVLRLG